MTLPGSWPKRTVTCEIRALDEAATQAQVVFAQTGAPWCVIDGVLVAPATISADFTDTNPLNIELPRTDVATPTGRTWTATVTVGGKTFVRVFALPDGVGALNIAQAAELAPLGGLYRLVATVNGVGPDDQGNVTLDAGTGGTSGVTDHGQLSGLADDDHTQYHTDARADARYAALSHTHSQSQVTGLTDALVDVDTRLDTLEARPIVDSPDDIGAEPAGTAAAAVEDAPRFLLYAAGWPARGTTPRVTFYLGGDAATDAPTDAVAGDRWFPDTGA